MRKTYAIPAALIAALAVAAAVVYAEKSDATGKSCSLSAKACSVDKADKVACDAKAKAACADKAKTACSDKDRAACSDAEKAACDAAAKAACKDKAASGLTAKTAGDAPACANAKCTKRAETTRRGSSLK